MGDGDELERLRREIQTLEAQAERYQAAYSRFDDARTASGIIGGAGALLLVAVFSGTNDYAPILPVVLIGGAYAWYRIKLSEFEAIGIDPSDVERRLHALRERYYDPEMREATDREDSD